ncbi:hypothetical protein DFH27DRAFT_519285 [Peziza echinospora]|nr:hypothetical protein DFH27DRAFT_519285 [Peziza echinospora]
MQLSFVLLALLPALAHARFGQENAVQNIIQALGGGAASTLAGQSISTLLAGSSACDKLSLADQVLALTGVDAVAALAAAKALVAAEKNFNPFAVSIPTICDNPALPASIQLRGIVPKIDPAVDGAAAINALSATTLNAPLNANGRSVADLLRGQNFASFSAQP